MESGGDGNAIYNRYAGKKNNGVAQVWGTALNLSLGNGEYEIYDFTAGASRLLVDTIGRVGIGTTTPGYELHVNGQVAGTSSYVNASDLRYKKNVTAISNALEKLTSIDGVFYSFKNDEYPKMKFSNRREMGVIAQKVEKIFPEAVSKDEKGFRSVAYSMLIAPIIESIKEIKNWLIGHDKAIEQNQRKIASLESEVLKQKEENAAMKSWICSKDPKAPICK